MSEISFYHLQKSSIEVVLPYLLEKTFEIGKRSLVMLGSNARVETFNNILWIYKSESWLPHGSSKDGFPESQPIWLTVQDENPNFATFLFLADGSKSKKVNTYERCFELFNGNNADEVASARNRWDLYLKDGHNVTYWTEKDGGGWEKKN